MQPLRCCALFFQGMHPRPSAESRVTPKRDGVPALTLGQVSNDGQGGKHLIRRREREGEALGERRGGFSVPHGGRAQSIKHPPSISSNSETLV
ncbi:hypothetical protein LZ31DRAFT_21535 [Colletotrichum somersetense]|nr:hypothetical protein LZ31DRAFT_21535 [Colletotrichum somersetense]